MTKEKFEILLRKLQSYFFAAARRLNVGRSFTACMGNVEMIPSQRDG